MTNNKNTNTNKNTKNKKKTRLYFPYGFLQEADTDSELETLPSLLALA